MSKKILIIKLGSAGDVLRTTAILSGLKKKYPDSSITWLVGKIGSELLERNRNIDRIIVYSDTTAGSLAGENFDVVLSLDKAPEATNLATSINAREKYGFGSGKGGTLLPLNKEAEYSYRLGIDDDLKFYKNKKTYQELIYEITNLNYSRERYVLELTSKEKDSADKFFKNNELDKEGLVIGVNTGAGNIFANKNLKKERIIELIILLNKKFNEKILLLGGPLEKENNKYIADKLNAEIVDGTTVGSVKEFSALIDKCKVIITADTLALHVAIALGKPVVALFGPTCHQEIDLYDCGYKIITEAPCAPCYKNKCDKQPNCMDKINLEEIVKAVKKLIVPIEAIKV